MPVGWGKAEGSWPVGPCEAGTVWKRWELQHAIIKLVQVHEHLLQGSRGRNWMRLTCEFLGELGRVCGVKEGEVDLGFGALEEFEFFGGARVARRGSHCRCVRGSPHSGFSSGWRGANGGLPG